MIDVSIRAGTPGAAPERRRGADSGGQSNDFQGALDRRTRQDDARDRADLVRRDSGQKATSSTGSRRSADASHASRADNGRAEADSDRDRDNETAETATAAAAAGTHESQTAREAAQPRGLGRGERSAAEGPSGQFQMSETPGDAQVAGTSDGRSRPSARNSEASDASIGAGLSAGASSSVIQLGSQLESQVESRGETSAAATRAADGADAGSGVRAGSPLPAASFDATTDAGTTTSLGADDGQALAETDAEGNSNKVTPEGAPNADNGGAPNADDSGAPEARRAQPAAESQSLRGSDTAARDAAAEAADSDAEAASDEALQSDASQGDTSESADVATGGGAADESVARPAEQGDTDPGDLGAEFDSEVSIDFEGGPADSDESDQQRGGDELHSDSFDSSDSVDAPSAGRPGESAFVGATRSAARSNEAVSARSTESPASAESRALDAEEIAEREMLRGSLSGTRARVVIGEGADRISLIVSVNKGGVSVEAQAASDEQAAAFQDASGDLDQNLRRHGLALADMKANGRRGAAADSDTTTTSVQKPARSRALAVA